MKHIKQWQREAVVAVFLSLMGCVAAVAHDFSAGSIYYNINEKTLTAEVTCASNTYNSYSGQVVIPATVTNSGKTYKVSAVGDNAFRDCDGLTGVVFGSNVARIGKRAFLNCSALTTMNITAAVTQLDDYAFAQCGALHTVTMNNDAPLQVGNCAFLRCTSLSNVSWASCANLEGRGGVSSLGTNAFAECTSLTSIKLPGEIEHLGTTIFNGCTSITSITVTAEQPLALAGDPFGLDSSVTIYVPSSGEAGVSATLYQGAVGWRNYAIAELPYSFIDQDGYTYLKTSAGTVALTGSQPPKTDVVVRNNITGYSGENYYVTSIGDDAFKSKSVKTLDTSTALKLKSIGSESFAGCSSLTAVTLSEGITMAGDRAFANCTKLTSVQIPSSLRIVANGMFQGCTKLANVNLVVGVSEISENAFAQCTSLVTINLPKSITKVEVSGFTGTSALTAIEVDPNCLYYTDVEGVLYELRYGGSFDISEAHMLNTLAIYPSGKVDEVLYIPPGVTGINAYAVSNATHLMTVAVPYTTTVFGDNCFEGTNIQVFNYRSMNPVNDGTNGISAALKAGATLHVPLGMTATYQALDAWNGFKNIVERYDVYADSKFVYDWNSRNQLTLVDIKPAAVDANGVLNVPQGMTLNGINYYTTEFRNTATAQVSQQVKNLKINCDSLSVIDMSNDLNPLAALTSLEAISVSGNNPYFVIADNVLYNTQGSNLYYYLRSNSQESFTMPNAVDTIMPQAFASSKNLKTLYCNRTLKYIGNKAFEGCSSLMVVDNTKGVTRIGNRAFAGCTALTTFNGGEQLSSLGEEAFINCTKLRQFPFCHGLLTTIGDHAFKGCASLTMVVFGNMLTSIGEGAFENCSALSKVFFTFEVENIGPRLFSGCSSLSELWLGNSEPPQAGNDFIDSEASIALYVPGEAISAYRTTAPWSGAAQFNTCKYLYNGADVNSDKSVNAYDITLVYSVLLGNIENDIVGFCDVNRDGTVTAADITIIYDYILSGVNVAMDYMFKNNKNEGVSQYVSLSGTPQRIRALNSNSGNYVTSGLLGVSDNTDVASISPGTTNQGIQYFDIVPHTTGYLTLVAIVSDGTTCYYCAYPMVVQ